MKTILKSYLVSLITLYLVSQSIKGLVFSQGLQTMIITAAALAVSMLLIKPIINVLLLPINLMTFGLLKFLSSAVTLYLITMVVKGFSISMFSFSGFSSSYFSIPAVTIHGILAFVAFSLVISIINSLLHWIVK